jgi:hypothetical protein
MTTQQGQHLANQRWTAGAPLAQERLPGFRGALERRREQRVEFVPALVGAQKLCSFIGLA